MIGDYLMLDIYKLMKYLNVIKINYIQFIKGNFHYGGSEESLENHSTQITDRFDSLTQ